MAFIPFYFLEEFDIFIGSGWLDSSGQISHLEQVYGTSTDDCKIACRIKNACVAFTFVSTSNRCDLKNTQQAVTLQNNIPATVISGKIQGMHVFRFCMIIIENFQSQSIAYTIGMKIPVAIPNISNRDF